MNDASQGRTRGWTDTSACIDAVLEELGPHLVVGAPIGIGKPVLTLNELYRRAVDDPSMELTLVTGLTLARPQGRGELERRLLEPFVERVFGDVPEPAWEAARRADRLPPNVRVLEFYMQPGALLGSPPAQRDYVSSNYTHVNRDALDRGMNVFAQAVPELVRGERRTFSLSSNADLALDAIPGMRARRDKSAAIADVSPQLPFMTGAAEVDESTFDHVVRAPDRDHPLFGTPHEPVTTTDWMIALNASMLIRDGGMLQLGIGSLADAVCHLLRLRHEDNACWRRLLEDVDAAQPNTALVERIGGLGTFEEGLYAATEMLVGGYLALYRAGVLKRRVWPWAALQEMANTGSLGRAPNRAVLETLRETGAVDSPLSASDVERMLVTGILRDGVRLEGDVLTLPDGSSVPADLDQRETLDAITRDGLGVTYLGGRVAHAAFFLGSGTFYDELRALDDHERDLFEMTRIGFVNDLHGDETLKRLQCRQARFVNSALKVTLFGAAVSDTLDDGRVISGVGGQYNLVAKAHALEDGRALMLLRSTRESAGRVTSNVVFRYGNATIARHLRDLVVTEYGIADLRGKTDAECCAAMISIADSRFQPGLVAEARAANKLPRDWSVPARHRQNTRERLHAIVDRARADGALPRFPLGTDLNPDELVLARCLKATAARIAARRPRVPGAGTLARILSPSASAHPLLERMGLDKPRSFRERRLRLGLLYSLVTEGGCDPVVGPHVGEVTKRG